MQCKAIQGITLQCNSMVVTLKLPNLVFLKMAIFEVWITFFIENVPYFVNDAQIKG